MSPTMPNHANHANRARLLNWSRRYYAHTGRLPEGPLHIRQIIGRLEFPLPDRWPTRAEIENQYASVMNRRHAPDDLPPLLRRQAG